jgi:hypothetical protein
MGEFGFCVLKSGQLRADCGPLGSVAPQATSVNPTLKQLLRWQRLSYQLC